MHKRGMALVNIFGAVSQGTAQHTFFFRIYLALRESAHDFYWKMLPGRVYVRVPGVKQKKKAPKKTTRRVHYTYTRVCVCVCFFCLCVCVWGGKMRQRVDIVAHTLYLFRSACGERSMSVGIRTPNTKGPTASSTK